jgi:hypothetical protein
LVEYYFILSFFSILVLVQIERAGSKALFAVVTEISDSVLRGAETNGFNGMVLHIFVVKLCFLTTGSYAQTKFQISFGFRSMDFTKAY